MSTALLTSNAPGWLVLLLLAIAATAYLACGSLALISRLRNTATHPSRRRRLPTTRVREEVPT